MCVNSITLSGALNQRKDLLKDYIKELPKEDQREVLRLFDHTALDVFEHEAWVHTYNDAIKAIKGCDDDGVVKVMAELFGHGVAGFGMNMENHKLRLMQGYNFTEDDE